jgi:hypothetical protein
MLKSFRLFVSLFFLSLFLLSSQANAENPIVTQPTDFWFEYTETTQFFAQTFMIDGHPSDPQLWLYAEDGTLIADNDDYNGLQSQISREVPAGRYRLRAGTCCHQPDVWRDGQQWNIDYELTFNGLPVETTTSTTSSTTTTTTLPPTTTTELLQTTTTSTTTTTTTTTTTIPETTTTWLQTTTVPTTTTTTTAVPLTVPVTTTTAPATTTTTTSTTTTTIPVTTTTALPVTISPVTIPVTTIPPIVTADQAAEIATNPEVLAVATKEEAEEVFQALEIDELSNTQVEQLVVAVQSAPETVRKAFEQEINIFGGGGLDTYVPVGSNVPVGQRRTLIVVGVAMSLVPAGIRRK